MAHLPEEDQLLEEVFVSLYYFNQFFLKTSQLLEKFYQTGGDFNLEKKDNKTIVILHCKEQSGADKIVQEFHNKEFFGKQICVSYASNVKKISLETFGIVETKSKPKPQVL